jgi:hypothetical protein
MAKQPAKKSGWTVVSARVPPDLKDWILQEYKKPGCINDVILLLLQRLRNGRILGIKLEG